MWSGEFPRVDDIDLQSSKVSDIARCQNEIVNNGCTGNQGVCQMQDAATAPCLYSQQGCLLSFCTRNRQDEVGVCFDVG